MLGRDCPGDYKTLASEARQLTNVLEDISDKVQQEQIPQKKIPQLLDAYEACIEVLEELDKLLKHYNSLDTKSKRAWDRLKWDGEKAKTLRGKLTASVGLMNGFWTSLIHDNQVLIMEALGRLERDYAGGHREESMASVERLVTGAAEEEDDEDEDTAWSQIIRDLEDVGISPQDALEYREFIVDWFIRAVNEGRFMERPTEREQSESPSGPLAAFSIDLDAALPLQLESSPQGTSNFQNTASIALSTTYNPQNNESPQITETSVDAAQSWPALSPALRPVRSDSAILLSSTTESQKLSHGLETDISLPSDRYSPRESTGSPQHAADVNGADLDLKSIIDAWKHSDYMRTESLVEFYLAAVERGACITVQGQSIQPDRRLLRHLIGVSSSYAGNFIKAKASFEAAFNGIYLTGHNVDEGDIIVARWLGDTCLHLNELENTALAWAVALEGSVQRYGRGHDITRRVLEELHMLNVRTGAWARLHQSIHALPHSGIDGTDIFANTHSSEKHFLITETAQRLAEVYSGTPSFLVDSNISYRPRVDWKMGEIVLIHPDAWPFQYDWTFSAYDAIMLRKEMAAHSTDFSETLVPRIRTMNLKDLHYVTRRGFQWLMHAVIAALKEMNIEYKKKDNSKFICLLRQESKNMPGLEGVVIKFKKLTYRRVYGLKVTEVLYSTRGKPTKADSFHSLEFNRDTSVFREKLQAILQKIELEESKKENA